MTEDKITYEKKEYTLYFDEDTHTYFLEGEDVEFQPIISTTQVLHLIFPKKYEGISTEVLKKAAERGSKIHDAIYQYEVNSVELDTSVQELSNYLFIKHYYCIKCIDNEKPILLKIKDTWIAGRFDILAYVRSSDTDDKEVSLIDIKSTSTLDVEYLMWQLNIYRLGYEKCYTRKIKRLYGLHLKKDKRKLQKIDFIDSEKIIKKLEKLL